METGSCAHKNLELTSVWIFTKLSLKWNWITEYQLNIVWRVFKKDGYKKCSPGLATLWRQLNGSFDHLFFF